MLPCKTYCTIERAALTDANTLTGESGTGKELAAHAIHQASMRRDNAFISLDRAISDNLFESELFGHKKGHLPTPKAIRSAAELAHEGSLFLDELGNLPKPTNHLARPCRIDKLLLWVATSPSRSTYD